MGKHTSSILRTSFIGKSYPGQGNFEMMYAMDNLRLWVKTVLKEKTVLNNSPESGKFFTCYDKE